MAGIIPVMRGKNSYLGVDILKHVAAIGVIIQHMHSASRYSAATNGRIAEMTTFAQGAVLIFFLISGFFFRAKQEPSMLSTLFKHIQRYGKRLLIPFVAFSAFNAFVLIAMGKLSWDGAFWSLVTGYGVGMQMYFLSFLFYIAILGAGVQIAARFIDGREALFALPIAVIAVAVVLHFRTQSATGDSYRLFPLYVLAFLAGRIAAIAKRKLKGRAVAVTAGALLVFLGLAVVDFRFYFLAAGLALFEAAWYLSSILPNRRAPGSGGVYLLHTPIVNFAVSALLMKLGIVQWPNVLLSIAVTYFLCLTLTLSALRVEPRLRLILLE